MRNETNLDSENFFKLYTLLFVARCIKDKLTEQDKMILLLRYEGFSLKEIAEKAGFKTPSAVSKRIEKLAGAYEDFVSGEYSDFLDNHTT